MPELPEVEVTRLSLVERLPGAVITGLRMGKPLRWPLGCEPGDLVGRCVSDITRRGKYLWLALGGAQAGGGLLVHLGMSGSVTFGADPGPAGKHDHFSLHTSHGVLRLNDPRRFGAVVFAPQERSPQAQKLLGKRMGDLFRA